MDALTEDPTLSHLRGYAQSRFMHEVRRDGRDSRDKPVLTIHKTHAACSIEVGYDPGSDVDYETGPDATITLEGASEATSMADLLLYKMTAL